MKCKDIVDVGVSLGIRYRKLSDKPAEKIHREMISMWLTKQDDVSTPTLRSLINALKEYGFSGNIEKIECDNVSPIAVTTNRHATEEAENTSSAAAIGNGK